MGHVDALSRNHPVGMITSEEVDLHLQATQTRDPVISKLMIDLEKGPVLHFELRNGLVYREMPSKRRACLLGNGK